MARKPKRRLYFNMGTDKFVKDYTEAAYTQFDMPFLDKAVEVLSVEKGSELVRHAT